MRARLCGLFLVAVSLGGQPAQAQGFIEDIFRQIDRVGFHIPAFRTWEGDTLASNDKTIGGLGLRVSYTLLRGKCLGASVRPYQNCVEGRSSREDEGEIREIGDSVPAFEIYLQLEFTRISGFKDVLDSVELRGTFKEFPTIGVYGLRRFSRLIGVYTGFYVGLTELVDFQGFDDFDNVYRAEGSSFVLGTNAGLVVGVAKNLQGFIEFNLTHRKFNSVKWDVPSGTTLPSVLPRSLPANSGQMRVGLQVVLR